MSQTTEGRYGDVALVLYAIPFIASFADAMYLWVKAGLSSTLPSLVYVQVTQDPYVFLAGFGGVVLAAVIDFNSQDPAARRSAVGALSKRLQALAFLCLILAIVSAWYSAGFDPGGMLFNLLSGRYDLLFPALLVLLSFLILPSVKLEGANLNNLLVVILLIASPAALYELGKRNTAAGLGVGLILLLAAAFLLVRSRKSA